MAVSKLSLKPQKDVIVFCMRLLIAAGVLIGIWAFIPAKVLEPLMRYEARMLAVLLRLFGLAPRVDGATVWTGKFSVVVVKECLAVDAALLFVAYVLAYPARIIDKIKGVAFGVVGMHAANQLRLIGLFFTGYANRAWFEYVHIYFGQAFVLLAVIGGVGLWMSSFSGFTIVRRRWLFLAKVLGYSALGFALWVPLHPAYVAVLETTLKGIFSVFDVNLIFAKYKLHEGTFNIVAFIALMAATSNLDWRAKIRRAGIGLAVLAVTHMLFKLGQIYITEITVRYADAVLIGVFRLTAVVLPVVLWAWVKFPYRRQYRCPLCGEWKTGIAEHVRAKHGTEALDDERVKRVVSMAEESEGEQLVGSEGDPKHNKVAL
ncbi:MAG: exosortase H [Chitinivibrionales bacterium]|nr:exosortase H [Chitinivibrionales bacterium]MBD3358048.1 exosortase H [Chitinivibrionales bacterium]